MTRFSSLLAFAVSLGLLAAVGELTMAATGSSGAIPNASSPAGAPLLPKPGTTLAQGSMSGPGVGVGKQTRVVRFATYDRIKAALKTPGLSVRQVKALDAIPTYATITTETVVSGSDPVMVARIDSYSTVGIPIWQFEANQGYNDNGIWITSVAPVNYVGTSAYYPGWSVSNIDNSMSSPDTGVSMAQSVNEAIFSYSPLKLVTIETENATMTFHFNGGGYWRTTYNVTLG